MAEPQIIRLVDEVDSDSMLCGRFFENAIIRGPAVITPIGEHNLLDNCSIDISPQGTLDSAFIALPDGVYVGLIGVAECRFLHCAFENIAIAAEEDVIDSLKASLTRKQEG